MKGLLRKARYILEYVFFVLFVRFLLMLGFDRASNFCSYFARKLGPKLGVTKTARRNLEMAIGKDKINIDKTIDGLWDNYGRYIAEFAYVDKLPQAELDSRIEVEGLENAKELIDKNQPFMLCLGHLANWDFLIKNINIVHPKFSIVYRKANNPYVDAAILRTRQSDTVRMIAKNRNGARELVKAIKEGDAIAMLVDQKMNDGIEVPFFGKPAMTANAIAKLSLQYDYPILPAQIIRKKGSHFKAIVHPVMQFEKTGDKEKDIYNMMLKINKMIEGWVRENPEQWFWFHNRWKK